MEDPGLPVFHRDSFQFDIDQPVLEFASFWQRTGAAIIDNGILCILTLIASLIVSATMGINWLKGLTAALAIPVRLFNNSSAEVSQGLEFILMICLVSFILSCGYFAGFESSALQATPGKKVLGIIVTGMDGKRISAGTAIGRCLGKVISGMILYIGYIMAAFTGNKQALHDQIAGTLVIRKPR